MPDAKLLHGADRVAEYALAITFGGDDGVDAHGDHVGRDGPDVQVVDCSDAADGREAFAHRA